MCLTMVLLQVAANDFKPIVQTSEEGQRLFSDLNTGTLLGDLKVMSSVFPPCHVVAARVLHMALTGVCLQFSGKIAAGIPWRGL